MQHTTNKSGLDKIYEIESKKYLVEALIPEILTERKYQHADLVCKGGSDLQLMCITNFVSLHFWHTKQNSSSNCCNVQQ